MDALLIYLQLVERKHRSSKLCGYKGRSCRINENSSEEVGSFGITCNAICPGFMDTDMTKTIPNKVKEKMVGAIPVGRIGTPEDIANAAAFLASEYASYITGEVLNVSGGLQV